jgi:hypothetical protein
MVAKGDRDNYFLGFQITGDKEDPRWNVMLKKGKGLASASTVASRRGVESSGLKGAAASLKGSAEGGE